MKKFVLLLFMTFSLYNAAAQDEDMEPKRYTVKMGETVRMISKKFKIAPSEIYRLNRFAIEGIREGMVLHLLVPVKDVPVSSQVSQNSDGTAQSIASENVNINLQEIKHTVAPKETLGDLSEKYKVPIEEIKRKNEIILKKGLKAGQILTITND